MKPSATKAGLLSGCSVWAVLLVIFAACLAPAACLFALFTGTTDLAARFVGPIVCPSGSAAAIERGPVTYRDDDGFTREAMGAEMVCLDAGGQVVARPAPLPNWIWFGLLEAGSLALAGTLGLVLAAPVGMAAARRRPPARPRP